jgi:hypothetical protein
LRRAPGKHLAFVHDALIMPLTREQEPDQISLFRAELARALEFSKSAINMSATAELRGISIRLGIDPDGLLGIGTEEEMSNEQ